MNKVTEFFFLSSVASVSFFTVFMYANAGSDQYSTSRIKVVESSGESSRVMGPERRRSQAQPEVHQKIRYPEFNDTAVFRPAIEVVKPPRRGLIEGTAVDSKWFPANLFSIQVNSVCTSTFVGPNTVLTAGHCVDYKDPSNKARTRPMTIRTETATLELDCDMHPDYVAGLLLADSPRNSKDVAMCVLTRVKDLQTRRNVINLPNIWNKNDKFFRTMKFEHIGLNENVRQGDTVLLGGYGCQLELKNGQYYYERDAAGKEKFRVGNNTIANYRSNSPENRQGSQLFARFDTVSLPQDGRADLCKGDSGGSVFHEMNFSDIENSDFNRKIIAVNSGMAFYEDRENNNRPTILSVFADLTQSDVSDWIVSWANDNNAKICGVNYKGEKCRGGKEVTGEVHPDHQSHSHTHEHTHNHDH